MTHWCECWQTFPSDKSSSSRIDKRLRLSRSTLRPQLTAERSSHWDTAMLRGGGDNANIRISIESHKDGCYENNQLTPAFNSLTAVYNNTQCCHRNTACIGKVSRIIIFHGNWKRKFAEGSLRWKSPVTGARYFRTRQNQLLEPDNFLRPLVSESQFKWEKLI